MGRLRLPTTQDSTHLVILALLLRIELSFSINKNLSQVQLGVKRKQILCDSLKMGKRVESDLIIKVTVFPGSTTRITNCLNKLLSITKILVFSPLTMG
jgi:hypothetical protein